MISEIGVVFLLIIEDVFVYWAGSKGISKALVILAVVLFFIFRAKILNIFKILLKGIGL